jgi:hypothetical protein
VGDYHQATTTRLLLQQRRHHQVAYGSGRRPWISLMGLVLWSWYRWLLWPHPRCRKRQAGEAEGCRPARRAISLPQGYRYQPIVRQPRHSPRLGVELLQLLQLLRRCRGGKLGIRPRCPSPKSRCSRCFVLPAKVGLPGSPLIKNQREDRVRSRGFGWRLSEGRLWNTGRYVGAREAVIFLSDSGRGADRPRSSRCWKVSGRGDSVRSTQVVASRPRRFGEGDSSLRKESSS